MAVPWCAHVKIPSGVLGWRAGRGLWPDDTDCVKISGPQTGMQHTRAFVQSSLHLDTQIHGNLEVGPPDPGQRAAPDPRPRDPLWAWIRGGSVRGMSSSGEAMCMGHTAAGSCRDAAKISHDTR